MMPTRKDARRRVDRLRRQQAGVEASLAVLLAGVHGPMRSQVAVLQRDLRRARATGVRVTPAWLDAQASFRMLASAVSAALRDVRPTATVLLSSVVKDAAEAAAKDATADGGTPRPARPVSAAGLRDRVDEWTADAEQALPQSIVDGADAGEALTAAIDNLQTGLVTVSRTESMRTYRDGMLSGWQTAPDVQGWRWVCVDDARTCGACWAMNDTVHPLSETLDAHPRCRCTMEPTQQRPDDTASITDDGAGSAGFEDLDDATQYRVLGPGKLAALRAGKLTMDDNPVTGIVGTRTDDRGRQAVAERALRDIVGPAQVRRYVREGLTLKPAS